LLGNNPTQNKSKPYPLYKKGKKILFEEREREGREEREKVSDVFPSLLIIFWRRLINKYGEGLDT
jgi:hypothetical protein